MRPTGIFAAVHDHHQFHPALLPSTTIESSSNFLLLLRCAVVHPNLPLQPSYLNYPPTAPIQHISQCHDIFQLPSNFNQLGSHPLSSIYILNTHQWSVCHPEESFVIVAQLCHHLALLPISGGSFPAAFLCGFPALSQGK
jgi:hypothetical protein